MRALFYKPSAKYKRGPHTLRLCVPLQYSEIALVVWCSGSFSTQLRTYRANQQFAGR